jgi:hypothetical protein
MGQINLFNRDLFALKFFLILTFFFFAIPFLLTGVRSIIFMVDLQKIKFVHRTTH